ncbi:MAG: prepilin-type N-terminal cleavage/methylation domain-containing protein [Candidatus Hydrogenedentota bacterium]|nr:MAG: prepilin-type N-terminal cleavage/methylation domain-containing protein [Candidatus Hydrogenedentota bacterium]
MNNVFSLPNASASSKHFRGRTRAGRKRAFTLVELLVVALIVGIVIIILMRVLLNYFAAYWETQTRLRLQRDMRTASYWIRTDLTALAQRNGNFDLLDPGNDFSFLAADDPKDTQDWADNSLDNGLDEFTYLFSGNRIIRKWDPRGGLSGTTKEIVVGALEPQYGDSIDVRITLTDLNDSTVTRSDFNGTLGDYEYTTPIRAVEVELIFSKKPRGIFSKRPPIVERARLRSVALYRRVG